MQDWINKKISFDLKNLIDLKNISTKNTSIRALAYQLYESNGILKRNAVEDIVKSISKEERKKFRDKRMQTAAEGKQAPLLVDCPWLYSNIAKKK